MIDMRCPKSGRSGFTLVELLVVIAIIGVLMSLLFPAVNGALGAAQRATAQKLATEIATAVVMYETEYGRLPPDNSKVAGDLLDALMATSTNNNPRRVVFLAADNYRRNRGGVTNSEYLDPWGGVYQIKMDTDYENQIQVGGGNGVAQETIRKRVGVWNQHENQRFRVSSWGASGTR